MDLLIKNVEKPKHGVTLTLTVTPSGHVWVRLSDGKSADVVYESVAEEYDSFGSKLDEG